MHISLKKSNILKWAPYSIQKASKRARARYAKRKLTEHKIRLGQNQFYNRAGVKYHLYDDKSRRYMVLQKNSYLCDTILDTTLTKHWSRIEATVFNNRDYNLFIERAKKEMPGAWRPIRIK